MQEKQTIKVGDRLLEARQESLRQMNGSSLRPHGKLWGMDVFSWFEPNLSVLSSTIHSFPFPVIWMGSHMDITRALKSDRTLLSNLSSVLMYDASVFSLEDDYLNAIRNLAGATTVVEAFVMLKTVKAPQSVLLFTASGENTESLKLTFEEQFKIMQLR